ncbi:MAG: hypothetical protein AAFQ63_14055 [Cyanobacteria bacterium J06621_11]
MSARASYLRECFMYREGSVLNKKVFVRDWGTLPFDIQAEIESFMSGLSDVDFVPSASEKELGQNATEARSFFKELAKKSKPQLPATPFLECVTSCEQNRGKDCWSKCRQNR